MSLVIREMGDLQFKDNVAGEATLTRKLLVETTAAGATGVAQIVAETLIPTPGALSTTISPYGKLIVRDRTIQFKQTVTKDTLYLYEVSLDYDNTPETATQSSTRPTSETPPWSSPATFSYSTVPYETVVYRDKDGQRIQNSTGDNFEPQPVTNIYRLLVSVQKNYETFALSTLTSTINTINDGTITVDGVTYADGQCLMKNITIEKAYWGVEGEASTPKVYYAVSFEFEVIVNAGAIPGGTSMDTYKLYVLDAGLRIKDGTSKKWITGTDDNPPSSPELLDGSGAKLAGGGTPVYKSFDIYKKVSWAGFSFA